MLRKLFALTEQGAKDLKKGIIASVFTSLSLMTVSYTHLDVYKRQL